VKKTTRTWLEAEREYGIVQGTVRLLADDALASNAAQRATIRDLRAENKELKARLEEMRLRSCECSPNEVTNCGACELANLDNKYWTDDG